MQKEEIASLFSKYAKINVYLEISYIKILYYSYELCISSTLTGIRQKKQRKHIFRLKGDSNPNDKYVLSERAL